VLDVRDLIGARTDAVKLAFVEAVEAAFTLDDLALAESLLDDWEQLPPSRRTPFAEAHCSRLRARLAAELGQVYAVEPGFARATALFRQLSMPFEVALTVLEHGEYLVAQDRTTEAEPRLEDGRETFDRLKAKPWIARTVQAQEHQQIQAQSQLLPRE
jgi:hypothetical protein